MGTRPEAFAFELPAQLIAQEPAARRRDARLMVLAEGITHSRIDRLPEHLAALGATRPLVVLNHSAVVPARIFATRARDGRRFELLVCRPAPAGPGHRILAWVRGAKKLRVGDVLQVGELVLRVPDAEPATSPDPVDARARAFMIESGALLPALQAHGSLPLPPYVARPEGPTDADRTRYQTVFASQPGSVAAPTASLHFDEQMLGSLDTVSVCLHVGPGTFLPMDVDDVQAHRVGAERFEVDAAAVRTIAAAKAAGRRVIAVGTTVTRTLETLGARPGGLEGALEEALRQPSGRLLAETDLVIRPGFRFSVVDALMTNFHLPRSSLLMLVCSFGGRERVLGAYAEAVREGYRFYSYGDSMLVSPAAAP